MSLGVNTLMHHPALGVLYIKRPKACGNITRSQEPSMLYTVGSYSTEVPTVMPADKDRKRSRL